MTNSDKVSVLIKKKYLEFNITMMCNLRCLGCNRDSPFVKNHHSNLKNYAEDIKALSKVMFIERFRILGGEPLLVNNLVDYLIVAKKSGMFKKIGICTNGLLLPNQKDELFRHMDYIDVSIYPKINYSKIKNENKRLQTVNPHLRFRLNQYTHFHLFNLNYDNNSKKTLQVYRDCKIAHYWACHTFEDGYYYKCFKPLIQKNYDRIRGIDRHYRHGGIAIHEPDLAKRLLDYINDPNPLDYCRSCLGSSGKEHKHRQFSNPQDMLKFT